MECGILIRRREVIDKPFILYLGLNMLFFAYILCAVRLFVVSLSPLQSKISVLNLPPYSPTSPHRASLSPSKDLKGISIGFSSQKTEILLREMAPSVCDTSIHSAEAKSDSKLLASTNPDPLLHSALSIIPKDNDHKDDSTTITNHNAQPEEVDAPEIQKPASIKRAMRLSGIPMPSLPPKPVLPIELEDFQINYSNNSSTIHTGVFSQKLDAYLASLRQDYQRQMQDHESLELIVKEDPYFSATVVAELDAQDEDPFTLDSFENLMRMHAAKGKDFILARVTTQDPNDESKHYHSYYSAHQINKVLFRTQPDEGLLHRMKARNVSSYTEW